MKNDYNDVLLTTTNLTTKNTFFWLERTKTFAICTCKIDYFVKFCFVLFVRQKKREREKEEKSFIPYYIT